MTFIKVSSRIAKNERNYVIFFCLPPLYPGGEERGRLRLSLPKKVMTNDCVFFIERMPILYATRIRIINRKDVYVETGLVLPTQKCEKWKVFIDLTPDRCPDND
jgi:hypothetical protein